jgi:rubrerythrin
MFNKDPIEQAREKSFSKDDIAMALRNDIIAELDAINYYLQQARLETDKKVKKIHLDIANEEKIHLGEFLTLLLKYDPDQKEMIEHGKKEVSELLHD